jgi:hypothetical protein
MESNEEIKEPLAATVYRLRVQRIEEEKPADLDWRPDILYMPPKAYPSKRKKVYLFQIVSRKAGKQDIALIENKTEAKKRYYRLKTDLEKMSLCEFETKYGLSTNNTADCSDDYADAENGAAKDAKIDPVLSDAMIFSGINVVNKNLKK